VPFLFNWSLPPLGDRPDLIVLAAELAGKGGLELPIEVSAVNTFGALSSGEEHQLSLVAKVDVSLLDLMYRQDTLCEVLDRVHDVSLYLIDESRSWSPEA
jgi:hypothetical protein